MDRNSPRVRRRKIKREVLSEGLDSGLGGVIRGVTRRVRDALFTPRDDDRRERSRRGMRFDEREERGYPVDHAE